MEKEYSFKSHFKVGDMIFYANVEESVVRKLRLRTVEDTYMVGVLNKSDTTFIGRDKLPRIYNTFLDAKRYLDTMGKSAKLEIIFDLPDQLKEMEDEYE
jgi:hypothetical protein